MAEKEPLQQQFRSLSTLSYFDPVPASLVDFTELFAADVGQFTKYTENTPGTTSLGSNQYTVAHTGEQNDEITENTSAFSMPQLFVQINFDSLSGSPTGYNNMGVGIVKDVNNFLFATFWQLTNQVSIQIKIGGSNNFLVTVAKTLTAPFKLGLSLVGNSACAWVDTGTGWQFVAGYDVTSYYDFRTTGNLTDWKAGFTLATGGGSSTVQFSNFSAGRFGGVGMRDMTIVTNEDGTPYISGTKVYFTATCADPNGVSSPSQGGSYCGVFTLDLSNNAIVQTAVLMISRSGKTYNDQSAHIIYYTNGNRRLFIGTWGSDWGSTVKILHGLLTSGDILTGTNVVSGLAQLSLPVSSSYGTYDQMAVYDAANSRWLFAYIVNTQTSPINSYVALAYSTDLITFTNIAVDSAHTSWEGAKILLANGQYWVMVGGPAGSGNSSRVYDASLSYIGALNATFSGGSDTQPHPMVFPYGGYFYLLTFDNTKYDSNNFTWGQPTIQKSLRYFYATVCAAASAVSAPIAAITRALQANVAVKSATSDSSQDFWYRDYFFNNYWGNGYWGLRAPVVDLCLYEVYLTTAAAVHSQVSSPDLNVVRALNSAPASQTQTSDVNLAVLRALATAISVQSAALSPALALLRNLLTVASAGTVTSAITLAITRPLASSPAAVSAVSTPNVAVQRALATLAAVMSATSEVNLSTANTYDLVTAVAAISVGSAPILAINRPLTVSCPVVSATTSIILGLLRTLATSIVGVTTTGAPLLAVERFLSSSPVALSAVSAPNLLVQRNLALLAAVQSATSDVNLSTANTYNLITAIAVQSQISNPALAVLRTLAAAIAVETQGPDLILKVLRDLATAIAAQSTVSTPALESIWSLITEAHAVTGTSDGALAILRNLAAAIVVQTVIPDISLRTLRYLDLITMIAAQTQTSDMELILTFHESLRAKAVRWLAEEPVTDLRAEAGRWLAEEEKIAVNQ